MRRYTLVIRGGDCSSSESASDLARRQSIGGGSGYGAKHDGDKSLELKQWCSLLIMRGRRRYIQWISIGSQLNTSYAALILCHCEAGNRPNVMEMMYGAIIFSSPL